MSRQRSKRARVRPPRGALVEVCLSGGGCCGLPTLDDVSNHPFDFSFADAAGGGSDGPSDGVADVRPPRRDRFERRTG